MRIQEVVHTPVNDRAADDEKHSDHLHLCHFLHLIGPLLIRIRYLTVAYSLLWRTEP